MVAMCLISVSELRYGHFWESRKGSWMDGAHNIYCGSGVILVRAYMCVLGPCSVLPLIPYVMYVWEWSL